jgi:hypothetical protein
VLAGEARRDRAHKRGPAGRDARGRRQQDRDERRRHRRRRRCKADSNAVNKLGGSAGSDGIVVAAGGFPAAPGHVRITGNRVHDRAGTGIALRTAVRTFMVKENIVADVGAGIAIEGKGSAERVAVDNNELFDVAAKKGTATALGIRMSISRSSSPARSSLCRICHT